MEVVLGNKYTWYQYSASKKLSESKFGVFGTGSLIAPYKENKKEELMNQFYLTYELLKGIKASVGSFYSTQPGFRPSVNIQFFKAVKNLTVLAVPRIDICKNPSYDLMFLLEYKPKIAGQLPLYSKFQSMFNFSGDKHNRSYQYLRLGINLKHLQTGIAINFDAYGPAITYRRNYGLFIRKDFR
ncbi:hypothetical protein CNR22_03895 [Sphingobacteriaceae bacterium]|nr:hypothetical protein CNR22_03895 [Sphingobacteriaceae bacterium]